MNPSRLRDRDAVLTDEKLIFRVYGYSHPATAYICDPEYAPGDIYISKNPRALRTGNGKVYYKFFSDEGLRFVQRDFPKYTIWHEPLHQNLVGVNQQQIKATRHPEKALQNLLQKRQKDPLAQALQGLLNVLLQRSNLSEDNFGVFGSLLHNFYNPELSDMDLIVYGSRELNQLKETLGTFYEEDKSPLRNEFDRMESEKHKSWRFQNCSLKEYVWHQKRKLIYALFHDKESGRTIKAEFEPVKRWEEIKSEYDKKMRIQRKGWIKLLARVLDDSDAPFMPSIYGIAPLQVFEGKSVDNIQRVVSYVEEFRMQAKKDEVIIVEGHLEQVKMPKQAFHQITLTYGPRYYEQVLKLAEDGAKSKS